MSPHALRRPSRPQLRGSRGQGLVEFSLLLPVFLVLLLGMLEFGVAFNHNLTLEYATREGARIGADLVGGTATVPCANVDDTIVIAMHRVLNSGATPVDESKVTKIRIYQVNPNGTLSGKGDEWVYSAGATASDGTNTVIVNFKKNATQTWPACPQGTGRDAGLPADSIGVSITYTYNLITPLASALRLVGGPGVTQLTMNDATVMQLNPTPSLS